MDEDPQSIPLIEPRESNDSVSSIVSSSRVGIASRHRVSRTRFYVLVAVAAVSALAFLRGGRTTLPAAKVDLYIVNQSRTEDLSGPYLANTTARHQPHRPHDNRNSSVDASLCSCLNSLAGSECCRRAVLRTHKFGFRLARVLFGKVQGVELVRSIKVREFPAAGPSQDYRHAVFLRNVHEAFVSGYLYHKTGRECWLSPEGKANGKDYMHEGLRHWQDEVLDAQFKYPRLAARLEGTPSSSSSRASNPQTSPIPSNASLCRYLAGATEEDGMVVYISFALSFHYHGLLPYLRQAKERNQWRGPGGAAPKSRFFCFEDIVDPRRQEGKYLEMLHFLFPGGLNSLPRPAKGRQASANQDEAGTAPLLQRYSGGHATDPDPVLRRRLLELVERLDRDVFDGALSVIGDEIPCRGTIQ